VKVLHKIFISLGVGFLAMWMFQVSKNMDGSFQSLNAATIKYKYLAIAGLASFYFVPIINWVKRGMHINKEKIRLDLIECIFPSFNREVPLFIQFIRAISAGLFIYFHSKSISLVDGEIEVTFNYYWVIAITGILFFGLPYLFPKKDNS